MFGVSTPQMVAAAALVGCLGSLPLGDLPPDQCIETFRATRKLTSLPFSVNIFVHKIPELTDKLKAKYRSTWEFINKLAHEHHLKVELPDIEDLTLSDYRQQVDALIEEDCKMVSFTFGNLDEQSIRKFKNSGTTLIGTCTSVEVALILEKSGIDIICVQGIEAGGHRGSFQTEDIPEKEGLSLLTQVFDSVKVPLIYAGGILNGRTLLAAKILGASGCQVGSLLLDSAESGLHAFKKEKLKKLKADEIVLTKSFSGRYARGIRMPSSKQWKIQIKFFPTSTRTN